MNTKVPLEGRVDVISLANTVLWFTKNGLRARSRSEIIGICVDMVGKTAVEELGESAIKDYASAMSMLDRLLASGFDVVRMRDKSRKGFKSMLERHSAEAEIDMGDSGGSIDPDDPIMVGIKEAYALVDKQKREEVEKDKEEAIKNYMDNAKERENEKAKIRRSSRPEGEEEESTGHSDATSVDIRED